MINHIGTVSIFVSDQQRAKAFYTEKLGMELITEQPVYPGASTLWLSVKPKGAQTELILYLADQNWQHYAAIVGKSQAVTLDVSDIDALVADLKAKGVEFLGEVDHQPWGSSVFLRDSEGNSILLVEQPKR
ncbi:MAG: VOC family protein [Anaerolineae bacterium]